MPGMDGMMLCREIRKIANYRDTPIIMLTAKSDSQSIESAFAAGANDYITKPFDVKAINSRIEVAKRAMGERREAPELGDGDASSTGSVGLASFGPEEFQGLEQHTDVFSLGNYLSTMERHRVDTTSVFAAQIPSFEALQQKCTYEELVVIISKVWNGIRASADSPRLLGAYVGSGSFVCITPSSIQDAWHLLETQIEAKLECSELLRIARWRSEVSVKVGRPIRPNASKTKRVRPTFDRAQQLLAKRMNFDATAN